MKPLLVKGVVERGCINGRARRRVSKLDFENRTQSTFPEPSQHRKLFSDFRYSALAESADKWFVADTTMFATKDQENKARKERAGAGSGNRERFVGSNEERSSPSASSRTGEAGNNLADLLLTPHTLLPS